MNLGHQIATLFLMLHVMYLVHTKVFDAACHVPCAYPSAGMRDC